MTREALKKTIWEDLCLDNSSIIFCRFYTEYGSGIGNCLIEDMDDLFDDDGWFAFCYENVPNIPSVAVTECVTYRLGNGEEVNASGYDIDYLTDVMRDHPLPFCALLEEYADVLATIRNIEAPNPTYDVLGDEEQDEEQDEDSDDE